MATFWVIGQQILAVDINRMFGDKNWTVTYNAGGFVTQAIDTFTSTTYDFTYDTNKGTLTSYTDGTHTWTFTYDSNNQVTAIVVT